MSAAAPTSPAVVRSSSTSRRQQAYPSSLDRPHRTQSTSSRPSAAPSSPQRTQSSSHAHGRPSHSSHRNSASYQGNVVDVAQRDFEQSNVARPPSSHRTSARDYNYTAPTPARTDSHRSAHRSSSRSGHNRYTSDPPASPGMAAENGARHAQGSSTSARRRTTIGAQTGQWALGKTIGAGSMGKVKLARNLETGEQVAVKIVPRHSTDEHRNAQDRERADHSKEIRTAREAAIVTLVNHPYICGMRDVVRTNYHWYMLFEYVNGGQMLDYIISHGRLKEKQARKFGRQIASALDYCHRNSIVHRDLKIENILISKTGDIKIIDFGLSNLFSPRSHLRTFCGSLYFAAPELLQAKQYTGPEVDVWSFGIVLYVLVCGKVPFDDQSMPQLHAKIKKGVVEYPPWLSSECKNLISRMLVTDPRNRAGLGEIMSHPWIIKGFNTPPENFLPPREPLKLPLDSQVIEKMTGFDFGPSEFISAQLTKIIESEEYQQAVRLANQKTQMQTPEVERKRGVFEFYKRRNSSTSRDTLTNPSMEAFQLGSDPINAFSPLISVYYLVREKQERERLQSNPGALSIPRSPGEKPLKMPDLPAPEAAYTNSATYEMAGEKPTGGRSRPRARTHGEDEVTEGLQNLNLNVPKTPVSPAIITPPAEQAPLKKENAAAGLLRRFSTRRHKEPDREKPTNVVGAAPSANELSAVPRKSFSVRKTREKETPPSVPQPSTTQPNQPELLSPPNAVQGASRRLKALGRSTSVNSADLRKRLSRRGGSGALQTEPPRTSGSDKSSPAGQIADTGDAASEDLRTSPRPRASASRTRSLGHARRESIQARRANREVARGAEVPEETDQEMAEMTEAGSTGDRNPEHIKPVYLKGLFSVSTTSSKPLPVIRADIMRVLKELGVDFWEIKGGFSCRHAPSIDLNKIVEKAPASPPLPPTHRRRISFVGFMGGDRDRERDEFREQQRQPQTPRSGRNKPGTSDRSYTNSEESDESEARDDRTPRAPGETSTHVQNDLGERMVLKFEIFIVKVPLLSLHGIQFKKVDGGTWQYKNMAQKILNELRL